MPDTEMPASTPTRQNPPRKHTQERFMFILIGVFFTGVLLYTFTPSGPIRTGAMAAYSVAVVWLIFKYAF